MDLKCPRCASNSWEMIVPWIGSRCKKCNLYLTRTEAKRVRQGVMIIWREYCEDYKLLKGQARVRKKVGGDAASGACAAAEGEAGAESAPAVE